LNRTFWIRVELCWFSLADVYAYERSKFLDFFTWFWFGDSIWIFRNPWTDSVVDSEIEIRKLNRGPAFFSDSVLRFLFFSSLPVRNLESLSLFFSTFNPVITLEFAAPSSEFALELQGEMAQWWRFTIVESLRAWSSSF